MSGEVIVSSTTDSQEAVDAAARAYGAEEPAEEKVEPPSEPSEHEHPEDETEAESEPAEKPESEESPEEEEEQKQARGPSKSHKRLLNQISRLTGRNYRLQEQIDDLQARLGQQPEGGAKAVPTPAGPPRPTPDKFANYEDYIEALADWKIEERDRLKAQEAHNAYVQQVYTEYNQQVDRSREAHDDFDEVVGQSVSVPAVAINLMYELDNGAEVAYFLGTHPEVREQLLEWNEPGTKGGQYKIVVELDRISRQLNGKSSQPANSSSPTRRVAPPPPAPIKPVGATARSTVNPDQMNFRDYKKWYAEHYGPARR